MTPPDKTVPFRIWQRIATDNSLEVELLLAVACCETGQLGGFLPSGARRLLFDKYEFSKRSGHIFDHQFPDISTMVREKEVRQKVRTGERANEEEYQLISKASQYDASAARDSTYCGRFLVPCRLEVCSSSEGTEKEQIEDFIEASRELGALPYLRDHKWAEFGKRYNPIAMSQDSYDARLRDAYRRFKSDKKAMVASCVTVIHSNMKKEST